MVGAPSLLLRSGALLGLSVLGLTLNGQEQATEQLIEDVIAQDAEEGGEFTFNDAFSLLEGYERRPLDLNAATAEELNATYLLSPLQTDRLLAYREMLGGFISIYELQAVPGLDLETIRRMLPFVAVGKGLDDVTVPLATLLTRGQRELYVRGGRRLERARGYALPDPSYLGSPDRLYLKFRQRYGNQLSLGIVAEKDPGEVFFGRADVRRGFDYYGLHFFVRNLNRRVRALALGDFSVSFGQGLILYTGFGFGKSSYTTTVARSSPTLQPYASVNEFSFVRGAGLTLALGKRWETSVFAGRQRRTGNLAADSLSVSSLSLSGYHRTLNELADRRLVGQTTYGGQLKYRPHNRITLGLNFVGEHLNTTLLPRNQPYNRFYFRGTDLGNVSVDYAYRLRNFSFFGEVAGAAFCCGTEGNSQNRGLAMLHGVNVGLDPKADLALVYRRYAPGYRALNARPFGETAGGRNETGLYLGLELRPALRWRINGYVDLWRHPWLRYTIDAPSSGQEYRFRITYTVKRKLDAYAELRSETKGYGIDGGEALKLDPVVNRTRFQARLHAGYRITSALEWRSRFDVGYTEDEWKGRQRGFMFFQDLHYRPLGPFGCSARVAVFSTPGYDVRFYEYENGLTYNARVLPYYGNGLRSFLLLRYKGIRNLTLETRIARTQNTDGSTLGSGLEATDRTHRTEIAGQVVWRW
ncbi:helix-hairpin-helix protein [Neolewinella xylanilytica]|uniref:Helix-hairpin-helix protein n=1 Tax=Neolewinella xylanilytica TaxID=1514080 RepID=A0A2S6IAS9_9BACT|nr:helix-hairpin-helix domain-containing protein [Neolewinella xylanilytica]PPK88586.1 helix-hairpin-helix protein [Neolewinella xylanilytica]